MRIAIIGSRALERIQSYKIDAIKFHAICTQLATQGVVMTSGLCPTGPDAIAQRAFADAINFGTATADQLEVYVSTDKERANSELPYSELAIVMNPDLHDELYAIAKSIHPAWDKCNDYAKGMHMRNVHQILGYDLKQPVDAVVCWTSDAEVTGGTATAIKLAIKHNIPVFNFGKEFDEVHSDLMYFMQQYKLFNSEDFNA